MGQLTVLTDGRCYVNMRVDVDWTSSKQVGHGGDLMSGIARTGFVWHELMTSDVDDAQEFYREVAGLTTAPGTYPMVFAGEQPVGGLIKPRDDGQQWPSGGPEAHWVAYIGVDDVDLAASKAHELGGEVLVAPMDIPGFGRAAVLRDPQGAAFGVFRSLA